MNRSVFRPLRTRRITAMVAPSANKETGAAPRADLRQPARKTLAALGAVCLAFSVSSASYGSPPAESAPAMSAAQKSDPLLVRGRYLVENVGLCADCHSPRNEKGQFLSSNWLQGSPLPMKPLVPMPFAPVAPPIAGLPTMNEAQAKVFLTTGKKPDGSIPLPPMPPYRFSDEDANAVVAYLKSLGR